MSWTNGLSLTRLGAQQARIADNRVGRKERRNARVPSLLAGLLRDGHGRRMSPSHAVRSGKRYRYYITHSSELTADGPAACRLPAHDIEEAVLAKFGQLLRDRRAIASLTSDGADGTRHAIQLGADAAVKLDAKPQQRAIVDKLVHAVRIDDRHVAIEIDRIALMVMLGIEVDVAVKQETLLLTIPAVRIRHGKDVKLVIGDGDARQPNRRLVDLLAEARAARDALLARTGSSIKQVACDVGQCRSRFARLVRLSWLAPELVDAIVEGRHPPRLTPRLLLTTDLPHRWDRQKAMLGFA